MALSRRVCAAATVAMLSLASLAPQAIAQTRIKLGVIGPLTGDFAFGGEFQLNGARLKAQELNARNEGIVIEIISEDDQSKCDVAVAAARKLITRDRVDAILGAWQSTCTLAILPITQQAEVPQFTTSVAAGVTQRGSRWIYRVALPTKILNRSTLEYAVKNMKIDKVAIFTSNEEVGKSIARDSAEILASLGVKPLATEEWTRGDKDFTGQLGRIKASGARAIIAGTGFADMAIIARQIRQLGLDVQLIGGDAIGGNPKFLELAGADAEGMIFGIAFLPVGSHPAIGPFVERYKAVHGVLPDSWAAEFYDTVGMIYDMVKANGRVSGRKQINDYTRRLKAGAGYKGVMGEIHFDETGEAAWPPIIGQIRKGSWTILRR
jgi:branched-chain amino acid transport system substrate-binding protein